MDITTYLRQTIPIMYEPDLTSEEPLLSWMTESLSELALADPAEIVPVSTSDASHKYVRISGHHYVVWDVRINEILSRLLVGMQYLRLAIGVGESPESKNYRRIASSVFRHTLFSYLEQKLTRFPNTAKAFANIASEELAATQSFHAPEADLIAELSAMQKMLMFYHETTHALHAESDELRVESIAKLTRLLKSLRPMVTDEFESRLGADLDIAFPEIAKATDEQRLGHFAEELNCDLQAFVFTSMAIPNAPGVPQRAWRDSIGMLFGASAMLAIFERVLKLSVSKWSEFARLSSDGKELTTQSIGAENYLQDRPLFHVRRWNTLIAIGAVLERLGEARGEDALVWEEYVIMKTQGLIEAFEEYLVGGYNSLANPEFVAKVFARANVR